MTNILQTGKDYDLDQLDKIFNFDYKKPSGIKATKKGYLVLFSNDTSNPYIDEFMGEVVLYEGQNTGSEVQKLIYGNKDLYDAYKNRNKKILLFKNYKFDGEYFIYKEPYLKENGKWTFPLAKGCLVL
ncbi:hypothetical protein [Desulfopila sp. IMCC35008]|uniref:hypothetical protein n=1 Tax=Desulfopila sp. IMCC35008 TaxID=2653858 RepID=UPI0013D37CBD|nr:hypothetical protein [Desulfopila sp. IMCC35008]